MLKRKNIFLQIVFEVQNFGSIQESRPTRGSFREVSAEVVAEVSAEVSASFTEVSASFAEVSAVHSQKLPRFTQGNLQFYIVRKKCVNFVPTKIEIKRIK